MYRQIKTYLALVAGLAFVAPASAGEAEELRQELRELRQKVDSLEAQNAANLESEIDEYLSENGVHTSAQGGGALAGISIAARFTTVFQATVGLDQFDRHAANGDVDLDFDFEVTDNLSLFIYMTANDASESNGSGFPAFFGPLDSEGRARGSFLTGAAGFPAIAGRTFGGLSDGIGVNGTVPTDPGSVTLREGGVRHSFAIGDHRLHWEAGALNQRTRFLQNKHSNDANTQFLNDNFINNASILWLNDSTGRTVFGWHGWISFGDNKQFTLNFGWFNTPGQFFNQGQFMIQFSWRGEVDGREMNLRVMAFINEFFVDGNGDGDAGFGLSWDWSVTDNIGLFVRIAANGDDVNPVEFDASIGAVFSGLIGSRPDDRLGVAIGFLTANDTVQPGLPEDTEVTLEIYYAYMMEDGKLQITPHLMIVTDPGGNAAPWADDQLFILGVRIHVPF